MIATKEHKRHRYPTYEPPAPEKAQDLQVGKRYLFMELKAPHSGQYTRAFKARVVHRYRNYYLLEAENGAKTALTIGDLTAYWKAVTA